MWHVPRGSEHWRQPLANRLLVYNHWAFSRKSPGWLVDPTWRDPNMATPFHGRHDQAESCVAFVSDRSGGARLGTGEPRAR